MEKLIQAVAAFVVIMATTGQLPRLIREVRVAQSHLVQETKASKWGMPKLIKNDSPKFKLQSKNETRTNALAH